MLDFHNLPENERPLSDKQRWSIQRSTKRLNVWHGSVRSGKTVGTIYRFIQYVCTAPKGDLAMVGKTMGSLKRNVINPMIELLGAESVNYVANRGELTILGRMVHTFGAIDERAEGKIRGSTFSGAFGDEITLWPESFFQMLLSRLSVEGAKLFVATNPDNPNHWFYRKFLKRKDELDMAVFHFALEDNPYLAKSYVDALKKEYTGLWYKRFIQGLWCVAEGAVYDFFDEKLHVIDRCDEAKYYTVGIDYGTTNPTTFILYGHNPVSRPKVWAEREYYYCPKEKKKQKTDMEFSEELISFIKPNKSKIRAIYCDPSAESFQLQLKRDGVTKLRDANNDVLNGIRTVARMLLSGEYSVHYSCKNYIREFYSYSWDPMAQTKGEDKPIKTFDHCMDNGRYALHSEYGVQSYDITKFSD